MNITDFKTVRDLVNYMSSLDEKSKKIVMGKFFTYKYTKTGEYENENYEDYDEHVNYLKRFKKSSYDKFYDAKINLYKFYNEENLKECKKEITKAVNAFITPSKSSYNKSVKEGWPDTVSFFRDITSCLYFINTYAPVELKDEYIYKIVSLFEKTTNSDITYKFDEKIKFYNDNYAQTEKENEYINNYKSEIRKHKYTVLSDYTDSSTEVFWFDNSKFDSIESILEWIWKKGNNKYLCFDKTYYNIDNIIRNFMENGKVIGIGPTGYYYVNDKLDDNNMIPKVGFADELPESIYEYSNYEKKFYYRGTINDEGNGVYRYYDSLWMTYNKAQ